MTQQSHTAWRLQDGVLDSAPRALAQTRDGYLWIGSEAGLTRFDGVKFTRWSEISGQELPDPSIAALLGDSDGSLWIGSRSGIAHLKDGKLSAFKENNGAVRVILQDPAGTIWLARTNNLDLKGPLCRALNETLRCYDEKDGVRFKYGRSLAQDAQGYFWMGSDALLRWKPGTALEYFGEQLKDSTFDGVHAVAVGRDGTIWAGLSGTGKGLGLQRFVEGKWGDVVLPGLDGRLLEVTSLFVDRDNCLWVGTLKEGLYRIHADASEHFLNTDGLSGNSIVGFYQDTEGDIWVETKAGLDRFRDFQVANFTVREGLSAESAHSVVAARDKSVWISNGKSLDVLTDRSVTSIDASRGLPGKGVTSLFEDHAGVLWVGIDQALYTYQRGRFNEVTHAPGLPPCLVTEIMEDREQTIWALCAPVNTYQLTRVRNHKLEAVPEVLNPVVGIGADPRGGIMLSFYSGNRQGYLAHFDTATLDVTAPAPGADRSLFYALSVEPDGSVWGIARRQGLKHWTAGQSTILGTRNGLPCAEVYSWIKDEQNDLWLYTACGIVEVAHAELQRWISDSNAVIHVNTLTALDGAYPAQGLFMPKAARSPDGRLWFTNSSTLQMVDPTHFYRNSAAPPVHIERLLADRKDFPLSSSVRLPALTREVEIDFTALSFVVPEKVRFRFRLEGLETEWQDAGTHRQAFYGGLSPGSYVFRVIACNNDGVWNETGDVLKFEVNRAYYQSAWFWALCGVFGSSLLYSLYLFRLQQMAYRLKARHEERERIARDLHDTLLQSTQGLIFSFQAAADQMPEGQSARKTVESALDTADRVLIEGRNRIFDLRVPSAAVTELPEALAVVGAQLAYGRNETFNLRVEGHARPLPPELRDELYQIGREALLNAFRHAGAKTVNAEIHYGSLELRIRILDDGHGIEHSVMLAGARLGHYGLIGMRERARKIDATLTISSNESGTEIQLNTPAATAYGHPLRNWLMKRLKSLHLA